MDDALVSIWVGLGGEAPWSSSMPQMGSEHGFLQGQLIHRLWCQWWQGDDDPDNQISQIVTVPLQMRVGARTPISVCLTVEEDNKHVLFEWRVGDDVFAVRAHSPNPVVASSANWIVERPTRIRVYNVDELKPEGLHQLPVFNRVRMVNCVAADQAPRSPDRKLYRPVDRDRIAIQSVAHSPSRLFMELEPRIGKARSGTTTVTVMRSNP
jgi:hypothetical protein